MSLQNVSHAVMAQRRPSRELDLDYFPTPPWATRAFLSAAGLDLAGLEIAEPACGEGWMAQVLEEGGARVRASDVFPYGYGEVADFLTVPGQLFHQNEPSGMVDFVITNPPFKIAGEFIDRGLQIARQGVLLLCRLSLLEGTERYEKYYSKGYLHSVWTYAERVPMVEGRVDPDAKSATSYAWFWFTPDPVPGRRAAAEWVPPSREKFELDTDYRPGFLERRNNVSRETMAADARI